MEIYTDLTQSGSAGSTDKNAAVMLVPARTIRMHIRGSEAEHLVNHTGEGQGEAYETTLLPPAAKIVTHTSLFMTHILWV